jgi:hypothetical protein
MYKLIVILAGLIPVVLFLRTVLFGRSKVLKGAAADFRRQVDYLVWAILFVIGCALLYTVGQLVYSMWQ